MNAEALVKVVLINVVATVVAMWIINSSPTLRAMVNGRT